MKILALLCVRNEGAFLLDWIAHHRACGVTDFLVFSNDCQDGTDTLLDALAADGVLTHVRNDGPYDKGGVQFTALKAAAKRAELHKADWILPLDIDEFVNVHTGDGTLPALIAALPEATAITLTWRLFGNNGLVRYEDTPVPSLFPRAAPVVMHWPWRAAMFKTLYRNDGTYRKPGVHRPRDADPAKLDQARWFDGEGRALDDQFKTRRLFSNFGRSNYALAQLNHYPLGAMESFVLKADRGRAVHAADTLGLDYWVERNWQTDEDTSIARYAASTAAHRGALATPAIRALHDAAVQWRHQRFEALMQEEPFRALFGRLLMTPPSRPVPPRAAQFMTGYANLARQGAVKKP
ncbi:MAG: glycosyltransferase family 2 protein [Pseudomonadota bacterium]